jgi:exosortase E/protease (VPEID-CTERM system)
MALIFVFVSAYLVRFRKSLRFPRALLLLPVSVMVAFAANAVRIAGLVLVGAHISPDIAFGGFHSKAGWFLFCGIALSLVGVVEWTGVVALRDDSSRPAATPDLTAAYLLPELTLLVVSLFTGLFASGVDFLYPVRVVCAAAVLFVVGKHLRDAIAPPSWTSVALGVAVFGVWLLVAHDGTPALGAELHDGLLRLDMPPRIAFLSFRVVGSVLVVPVVEELAFRGYLQRRFIAEDFAGVSLRRINVVSLVGTALCFGALHQSFVAAVVASLAYSAAGCLRGRLADAVAAHATTNALIAVWVLALGRWDLWV